MTQQEVAVYISNPYSQDAMERSAGRQLFADVGTPVIEST